MKRFFILCVVSTLFFLGSVPAFAQLGLYFGGPILISIPCTCNGNYLLYIYDYKSKSLKTLVYQQGYSRLYLNYNIQTPLIQTLGSYDPIGVCLMTATPCTTMSNNGMINNRPGVGTGSIPAF